MRRSLAIAIALMASPFFSGTAQADGFSPDQILFPVDGDHHFSDTFGAPRGDHLHEGIDIMADKGVPVVAAASGVVTWMGSTCCGLALDHGNGWATWYIHLNNDTPGTDDGQGWGIADGIEQGTAVTAGQLIGWVGDSGNAESSGPHLHFEIRKDGEAINAYPYLLQASGVVVYQFGDTVDSTHRENIEKIYADGITKGCNPPANTMFCPQRNISRGEMAAFISRALGLTEVSGSVPFDDVAGNTFEGDIDRIVTAGIGFGCDEDSYCPDRPLLRDEMAELLVRAFEYDNPDGIDHFIDDEDNAFADSINRLATHHVTLGCNPPDNDKFCPDRTLTRAEMASFFVRAKDL